jgi:CheY-like chemotaxis protein
LAVVARIVEQLQGQLRAESEVDVGSRFFFTLSMLVDDGRGKSTGSSAASDTRSIAVRPRTLSSGSGSIVSGVSAPRSEIDNFVEEFGASHMFGPVGSDDRRLREAEARMAQPGTFPVTDSSYPVRPSRMGGEADSEYPPGSTSTKKDALPPASPANRPRVGGRSMSYARSPKQSRSNTAVVPMQATLPSPESSAPSKKDSPRETPPASPPTSPLRSKKGPKGEQRLKVLVVEDDAINSQILQKRLRMDKHSVVAVSNGQEAVDALKADWDIDAVLMDIQ